jgi:hypothetical protein
VAPIVRHFVLHVCVSVCVTCAQLFVSIKEVGGTQCNHNDHSAFCDKFYFKVVYESV